MLDPAGNREVNLEQNGQDQKVTAEKNSQTDQINFLEYPIPAATATTATARQKKRQRPDLRNQAWYHRSAGVKTTR